MNKVTIVAHPETKALFTPTSNPDWVKCQLQSEEVTVNNGVMRLQKRVAFPLVDKKVADMLAKAGLKSGHNFPVPGKIIRKLTSQPQYEGQTEVVNPSTGEAMGYYQSYTFTSDLSASDIDEREAAFTPSAEVVEEAEDAAIKALNV